ncbi:hypothetical protein B9479_007245 [Cryptococcus floricola]|uniref:Afadin and alpha-actinin-binding-domain-containing protein n=1 Tax=Cryptococcus floricola TaxID=2591691 RepID=A0A5D3ANA7_9TREE|nr:hypothetical protein B9479_007245 [Cryptococcus floricola]
MLSAELSTINSQLMSHGWAKRPLQLNALSEKDHNDVVAVLFELLGASVSNLDVLETLNGRHRTLEYEYERLQKTTNNFKTTNERLDAEAQAWKFRCAEMEKRLLAEQNKTKELREENARGRKALETVKVAAVHETKKIQTSLDKALGQLAKVGDLGHKPQGLVLLNPIPAGRIQPVAVTQSPLLEQTLRDLTDIQSSLQEETEAFRHVTVTTGNALREALAASMGQEPPQGLLQSQFFTSPSTISGSRSNTSQSASSLSHPNIAQERLQSLIADLRTRITDGVPQWSPSTGEAQENLTPEEIEERKREERDAEKQQRDLHDRIKDLEVELECAKRKEDEASKVVADYAKKQIQQEVNVNDSKDDFEMEKQRQALDQERRRYAEEAVKLREQRRHLEDERATFLEDKRQKEEEVAARLAALAAVPIAPVAETAVINQPIPEEHEVPKGPSGSNWFHQHRPHSPSPLSPQGPRVRTPKAHMAGGRRKSMKTPLSRLVLEKAVRQKGKAMGISELLIREKDEVSRASVLGAERGRKTNLGSSSSVRPGSPSRKGKEKAGENTMGNSVMRNSTSLAKSRTSAGSTGSAGGTTRVTPPAVRALAGSSRSRTSGAKPAVPETGSMRTSTGSAGTGAARKHEIGQAGGVGPNIVGKKSVWRG